MKKCFCLMVFVSALALVLATAQTTSPSAPTNPAPPKPPNPVGSEQTPSAAPQTGGSASETAQTGGSVAPQTKTPPSNNTSTPPGTTTNVEKEQTPSAETAVPASQLQSQIQNALKNEPTLANDNVTVTVSDEEIDLSGNVTTAKQKLTAKRIVQSYAGNRKVKDRLTLAGHNPQ